MRGRPSQLSGLVATLVLAMATGAVAQAPAPVIYTIEQRRTGPISSNITQQMIPLHTLAAVETLLKVNRISFAWTIADISSDKLPPEVVRQIAALPPGEVFVIPGASGVLIGVIIGQR